MSAAGVIDSGGTSLVISRGQPSPQTLRTISPPNDQPGPYRTSREICAMKLIILLDHNLPRNEKSAGWRGGLRAIRGFLMGALVGVFPFTSARFHAPPAPGHLTARCHVSQLVKHTDIY